MKTRRLHLQVAPFSSIVMQITRFSAGLLRVAQYPTGNPELDDEFELWTAAKIPTPDNERGLSVRGTLAWVYEQAIARLALIGKHPYRTFLFYFAETGELVATASFVQDDRGVQKRFGLTGLGVWGYVNVDVALRGRGIGTIVCQYMQHWIQRWTDIVEADQQTYLFTADTTAMGIYRKLGWQRLEQVMSVPEFSEVPGLPPEEPLFGYLFTPGDGSSALLPGAAILPLFEGAVNDLSQSSLAA